MEEEPLAIGLQGGRCKAVPELVPYNFLLTYKVGAVQD